MAMRGLRSLIHVTKVCTNPVVSYALEFLPGDSSWKQAAQLMNEGVTSVVSFKIRGARRPK